MNQLLLNPVQIEKSFKSSSELEERLALENPYKLTDRQWLKLFRSSRENQFSNKSIKAEQRFVRLSTIDKIQNLREQLSTRQIFTNSEPNCTNKFNFNNRDRPINPLEIQRILTNEKINLLIPWGPRFDEFREDIQLEIDTITELKSKILGFTENQKTVQIEFLFADYYGYAINNLQESKVKEYFEQLSKIIFSSLQDCKYNVKFSYWSVTRETISPDLIEKRDNLCQSNVDIQKYINRVKKNQSQYPRERILEALYSQGKSTIFISLATSKSKDPYNELNIPTIYPLSRVYQAPWLK
jgi:hypothetical protein